MGEKGVAIREEECRQIFLNSILAIFICIVVGILYTVIHCGLGFLCGADFPYIVNEYGNIAFDLFFFGILLGWLILWFLCRATYGYLKMLHVRFWAELRFTKNRKKKRQMIMWHVLHSILFPIGMSICFYRGVIRR